MVNFAVDTEEVWMCTQLKKEKSYFLPFNKGYNNSAGNPPNDGIKTDYLWKEILTKNNLTNIIQNFCQLITEEKEYLESSKTDLLLCAVGLFVFCDSSQTSI